MANESTDFETNLIVRFYQANTLFVSGASIQQSRSYLPSSSRVQEPQRLFAKPLTGYLMLSHDGEVLSVRPYEASEDLLRNLSI